MNNLPLPPQITSIAPSEPIKAELTLHQQLKDMKRKLDDQEEVYQNISKSNRLKKLNARKELNKIRVEYNKLNNKIKG